MEPIDELVVLVPSVGVVQCGPGLLLSRLRSTDRAKHRGSEQAFTHKALSSDEWTRSKEFPGTLFRAGHVATSTCHGDDFLMEAPLQGSGKVEASQRSHLETKRLLSSYPTETASASLVCYFT